MAELEPTCFKSVELPEAEHELGTDYQKYIHYVYVHKDPRTNETRYIGMGTGQRAWMMGRGAIEGPRYGHRKAEHFLWFKKQEALGHTLEDIVFMMRSGLTKEDALLYEAKLIELTEDKTRLFNSTSEDREYKYSQELCNFAKGLYDSLAAGYQNVSYLLGAEKPKNKVMTTKRMIKRGR